MSADKDSQQRTGLGAVIDGRLEVACGACGVRAAFFGTNTLDRVLEARSSLWRQSEKYGWVCPEHRQAAQEGRGYLQSALDLMEDPGE